MLRVDGQDQRSRFGGQKNPGVGPSECPNLSQGIDWPTGPLLAGQAAFRTLASSLMPGPVPAGMRVKETHPGREGELCYLLRWSPWQRWRRAGGWGWK